MEIDLRKGDCLEVMDKLIEEGVRFKAIVADIPFGTTACKHDVIIPFEGMWSRLKKLTYENSPIILFSDGLFTAKLQLSNSKMFRYDRIWNKELVTGFLNANKMPLRKHETINIFYKKLPTYNPQKVPGRKPNSRGKNKESNNSNYGKHKVNQNYDEMNHPTSIISIQKVHPSKTIHPTEKPIELMEELIKTYTNEGDNVLDFTCGAGATVIACRNLNRSCTGIDKFKSDKKGKYFGWHWIDVVQDRLDG